MTLPPAPKRFCPSCDEQVPTVWVETGGWYELRCGYCGLTLGRRTGEHEEDTLSAVPPRLEASRPLILVAEDSRLLRKILTDNLCGRFPRARLEEAADGAAALEAFVRALREGARQGILVLDVGMPKLDGITVAHAVRAVERGFGVRHFPVLFFSAQRANEELKANIQGLAPAAYLHKGIGNDPDLMLKRLEKVMAVLVRNAYGGGHPRGSET